MAPSTTLPDRLFFTGDADADRLLVSEPLALLIGFALDQQVGVQKAFGGPLELQRRIGTLDAARIAALDPAELDEVFRIGTLDAARIAALDPAELDEVFRRKPALHRFPGAMAGKVQALCAAIVADYGNQAARVWTEAKDGGDLEARLLGLPGIGPLKAKSLIAIVGLRLGVRPPGWEEVAPTYPTLGGVDSYEALASYQEAKRAYKATLRAGSA